MNYAAAFIHHAGCSLFITNIVFNDAPTSHRNKVVCQGEVPTSAPLSLHEIFADSPSRREKSPRRHRRSGKVLEANMGGRDRVHCRKALNPLDGHDRGHAYADWTDELHTKCSPKEFSILQVGQRFRLDCCAFLDGCLVKHIQNLRHMGLDKSLIEK
ncbi:uncharacterized protein BCR38DRAFT_449440 [Pseudomassariella vexata]|uniref:Uncharacterized protein n=1 Tax=Pseudomassariella vexata TaxID=1141098 RepID=A0A1Y2DEM9_9PEZI|nr:uncharacterized protein BCR38DRAFT_449440 [Pseudomassariella vexata]ORY57554.1 hypothetical protein BCR38DRAFT_449440 [Pseudomassariella vexata]